MSLSACIEYRFKYFEMGLIKYSTFIISAFELLARYLKTLALRSNGQPVFVDLPPPSLDAP